MGLVARAPGAGAAAFAAETRTTLTDLAAAGAGTTTVKAPLGFGNKINLTFPNFLYN